MPHPYASLLYAESFLEPELKVLEVPPWNTHVLVRRPGGRKGVRIASGVYPFASLDPDCDLRGGLELLKEKRIGTVTMLTDALWSPPAEALQEAFDFCRPLKHTFLLDRETVCTDRLPRALIPIPGVPEIALHPMQMGVYPTTIRVVHVLGNLMRGVPIPPRTPP